MKYLKHNESLRRVDNRGASTLVTIIAIVVVIAVLAAASVFVLGNRNGDKSEQAINKNEFQALFLTNGQVYFGKLSNVGEKYVTLTDIYYLQVQTDSSNQNLQQASGSTSNSKVSLAKLGSELHGPEDKMEVSRDQVLFWENLKSDSKVVQAISKYQNQ